MEKKDQEELLHKIKQHIEKTEIPESIKPQRIEQLLQEKGKRERFCFSSVVRAGMAVAAVLVIGTVGIYMQKNSKVMQDNTKKSYTKEVQSGCIGSAADYGQLFDLLKNSTFNLGMGESTIVEDKSVVNSTATSEGTSGSEYSKTNEQVDGVSEGDLVKTDGTYIYSLQEEMNEIVIMKANEGNMEQLSSIKLENNSWVQEIYVQDNKIILIVQETILKEGTENIVEPYYASANPEVRIITYDISDKKNICKSGEITLDGNYLSSRIVDGCFYIFSHYTPEYDRKELDTKSYVPSVNDKCMNVEDIYLSQCCNAGGYLVIASMDLKNPEKIKDNIAVMMYGEEFYVSNENVYIAETSWKNQNAGVISDVVKSDNVLYTTKITKLSYHKGVITPAAVGEIKGMVDDRYSMDEYQGYLRVVATQTEQETGDSSNALYILDDSLYVTGSVENLANGERVYSARFMGNTGYFVTYRQTDPLFSVDLTDVTKPVVLGELKVSGFSEYLHFYGEHQLLGMGWETNNNRHVGLKLSLFDITDPAAVVETDKVVIDNVQMCPGLYNPKAFCIDSDKNIIGFQIYKTGNTHSYYCTYSYQPDNGFVKTSETKMSGSSSIRGLFIGKILYIIDDGVVKAVSLENGEEIGSLSLNY